VGLWFFVIGALVGVIYYYLNKSLSLGFGEENGKDYSINFKRSIMENMNIDEEQAKIVIGIIRMLLEGKAFASANI